MVCVKYQSDDEELNYNKTICLSNFVCEWKRVGDMEWTTIVERSKSSRSDISFTDARNNRDNNLLVVPTIFEQRQWHKIYIRAIYNHKFSSGVIGCGPPQARLTHTIDLYSSATNNLKKSLHWPKFCFLNSHDFGCVKINTILFVIVNYRLPPLWLPLIIGSC